MDVHQLHWSGTPLSLNDEIFGMSLLEQTQPLDPVAVVNAEDPIGMKYVASPS